MHIHGILILFSVVVVPASCFKAITSCPETATEPKAPKLPQLGGTLRQCTQTSRQLSPKTDFMRLVRRGKRPEPEPSKFGPEPHKPRFQDLADFQHHEVPSAQEPSSSRRSPKKARLSSPSMQEAPDLELKLGPPKTHTLPSTSASEEDEHGYKNSLDNSNHVSLEPNHQTVPNGYGLDSSRHVHLDPNRQNIPDETRPWVIYHLVAPDPERFQSVRNIKTGERSFYRKMSDSVDDNAKVKRVRNKFKIHLHANPPGTIAIRVSRGQRDRYWDPQAPARSVNRTRKKYAFRPAKWEEMRTTGIDGYSVNPEWHRITPKTQDQLPPGVQAWTDEDLGRNLKQQQLHFKNHEAGQKDSVYAGLDSRMRYMCNTEQCKYFAFPNATGGHGASWQERQEQEVTSTVR